MKKAVTILIIICILSNLEIINVEASSGKLKSSSIISCNGVTYGQHSADNHWHIATKKESGDYYPVGEAIYNNPCNNDKTKTTTTKTTTKKITTTQSTTKKIEVYGCINSEAINYNNQATLSDGSCQFEIITTIKETIPFETKIVGEKNDKKEITQKGQSGLKEITETKIIDENNNVISTQTHETIIEEPITEIIEYQTIPQKEETSSLSLIIFLIPYLIPFIYSKKHNNIFMIINKIKQYKSHFKYIFYILYIFNPLVLIIDIFLVLKNIFYKKIFLEK